MNMAVKKIYDVIRQRPDSFIGDIGTSLVAGTVISISPLQIRIDAKTTLGPEFLTLSILCKNYRGLWRGLRVGDTVNMISMSGNQQYYVMERQGMEYDTSD